MLPVFGGETQQAYRVAGSGIDILALYLVHVLVACSCLLFLLNILLRIRFRGPSFLTRMLLCSYGCDGVKFRWVKVPHHWAHCCAVVSLR